MKPFQRVSLPELRGSAYCSGIEIEDCANGSCVAMDVELLPLAVNPFLLLGCCHANPEEVGVGVVDGIDDLAVVFVGKLGLEGWREGDNLNVGIFVGCALADKGEHIVSTANEHADGLLGCWSFGRLVVWSFGCLVVWSFGRLGVGC